MSYQASFSRPDRAALARRWQALEARSDASFFLRWTWIGAWLDSYRVEPELLAVVDDEGRDIALALVGHAMQPRLLGPVATLRLNQSGDPAADRQSQLDRLERGDTPRQGLDAGGRQHVP